MAATPFRCGRPIRVDDADFDITRHLGRMVCLAPGNEVSTNHQRLVHTFVTNVHGADHPMRLGGAPVVGLIPLSATAGNVTVASATLCYADAFAITIVANPDHEPDLLVLTEALHAELGLLDLG